MQLKLVMEQLSAKAELRLLFIKMHVFVKIVQLALMLLSGDDPIFKKFRLLVIMCG